MRFVVARRLGRRGEGLGNEMLPWAKGAIASQVLDATLVGPSFGLNKRRYYRNFGTGRFDFVWEDLLARLPHHAFTETDFLQSGKADFGEAVQQWAEQRGLQQKKSFIVTVDGMYGGYSAIRNARPFLLSKLLGSEDAIRNVYQIASKLDRARLFVAVHMRFGGDFTTLVEGESARGRFNLRIPGGWYLSVCEALLKEFGDKIRFHFFTDRGGGEFDEAVRRFNPEQKKQPGLTECSDLLLMSQADLRVCSVSSYSLMASFLADGPYLWYEPQLSLDSGLYTLWGSEESQRLPGSPTMQSHDSVRAGAPSAETQSLFRGYPMSAGDSLPGGLRTQLQRRLALNQRAVNLLEYGCVPAGLK